MAVKRGGRYDWLNQGGDIATSSMRDSNLVKVIRALELCPKLVGGECDNCRLWDVCHLWWNAVCEHSSKLKLTLSDCDRYITEHRTLIDTCNPYTGRKIKSVGCKVCGYMWTPGSPRVPVVCPRCSSHNWNGSS